MRKSIGFVAIMLVLITSLWAGNGKISNQVEKEGTYRILTACLEDYHTNESFIEVASGNTKRRGERLLISLTDEQMASLSIGDKIKIKGKKNKTTTKKVKKSKVIERILSNSERKGGGLYFQGSAVNEVIDELISSSGNSFGHDHTPIARGFSTDEELEVIIPEHIVVETINITK